ncbi:MAG: HNH endonuclease [Gammaproteobacteria bacterium]|nr:HNH endonuclease [Gammaproteobacteria bacterium]
MHRVAYELFRKRPGRKVSLCHRCDNRACFNPGHLLPGTQLANTLDAQLKGRKGSSRNPKHAAAVMGVEIRGHRALKQYDKERILASPLSDEYWAIRLGVKASVIKRLRARAKYGSR